MRSRALIAMLLAVLLMAAPRAFGTDWENPVFHRLDDVIEAALLGLEETSPGEFSPREMFTLFTVSSAEAPHDPRFKGVRRQVVESFVVTFPSYLEDPRAKRTLEAFLAEVEDEKTGIRQTMERFGFPKLPGLTYLKLVENVDELQGEGPSAAERSVQINGLTYFCRYVVIPLSYVTARNLKELGAGTLASTVDVDATLRSWHRESFRVMLSTFRHELIHVWTNASLGVPRYRDREHYPDWFLEGSASFLAGDPHEGLSDSYKEYQNLFFYLVERHGVDTLGAFFEHILAGSTVRESLEKTYGIRSQRDLRTRQGRWHGLKEIISSMLALGLLIVVLAAFASNRLPIFGSLQLWLAITLAYATFSGFCAYTQALNGATAVVGQQAVFGALALLFGTKGLRSVRRSFRAHRG